MKCWICKNRPHDAKLKGIAFCRQCLPWEPLSLDQVHHYFLSRLAGTSHKLALMFATGQGPGLQTDSIFCSGGREENQFKDARLRQLRKRHEKKGVSTTGKIYMSQLARFPGDPEAWVSGRGEVAGICKRRGWGVTGTTEVKPDLELALERSADPIARKKLKEARGH